MFHVSSFNRPTATGGGGGGGAAVVKLHMGPAVVPAALRAVTCQSYVVLSASCPGLYWVPGWFCETIVNEPAVPKATSYPVAPEAAVHDSVVAEADTPVAASCGEGFDTTPGGPGVTAAVVNDHTTPVVVEL